MSDEKLDEVTERCIEIVRFDATYGCANHIGLAALRSRIRFLIEEARKGAVNKGLTIYGNSGAPEMPKALWVKPNG